MGLFQGVAGRRITRTAQIDEPAIGDALDEALMRRESVDLFAARIMPEDPYAAWLQQREAEREQPAVRWVHRHPAAHGATGSAGAGRSAQAGETAEGLLSV